MKNKGITMISLIITIIILIILVGITISTLINKGLLLKTEKAKSNYEEASAREIIKTKILEFQLYCIGEMNVEPNLKYMKESNYFKEDKEIKNITYFYSKTAKINWDEFDENGQGKLSYAKIYLYKYSYVYTINEKLEIIEINDIPIEDFDSSEDIQNNISEKDALEYLCKNIKLPTTLKELINNDTFINIIVESKNNIDYIINNPNIFKELIISNEKALKVFCSTEYSLQQIINNKIWYNAINSSQYRDVFEKCIKEKLISTAKMTSNNMPKYEAKATSEYKGRYYAYLAFDKKDDTFWYSNGFTNGNGGQAIGYDFGEKVYIYKFELIPRNNGSDTKSVKEYKLQGSNDGINWDDIEIYTNDDPTDKIVITKDVDCNTPYSQYRIEYISTFNGTGTTYASVWELEFYCYRNNIKNNEQQNTNIDKFVDYSEELAHLYVNSELANLIMDFKCPNNLNDLLENKDIFKIILSDKNNINYIINNPKIFKDKIILNYSILSTFISSKDANYMLDNNEEWKKSLESSKYSVKVPEMTSNINPNGKILVSSEYMESCEGYRVFDRNSNTFWRAYGNTGNEYIQYEFEKPNMVYKFSIHPNYIDFLRMKNFVLYASNDGKNFEALTDILTVTEDKEYIYYLNAKEEYKYYKIVIKDTWGNSSSNDVSIREVQFYGINQ